jgi:hypothetical protein
LGGAEIEELVAGTPYFHEGLLMPSFLYCDSAAKGRISGFGASDIIKM